MRGTTLQSKSRSRSLALAGLALAVAAFLPGAAAVEAQTVAIVVSDLPCLPMEGNSPLFAAVSPAAEDLQVRTYFRRQDFGDYYYLNMKPLGGGNYWIVLPKPERQNEVVEFHVTVLSADGVILGSTRDQREHRVAVIRDCEAKLSKQQEEESESLIIGETHASQKGKPVAWFLCDGITHRIDTAGRLRSDEFCALPPGPVPILEKGAVPQPVSPEIP